MPGFRFPFRHARRPPSRYRSKRHARRRESRTRLPWPPLPVARPAKLDTHEKLFEALTTKIESLQNQNSDLLDQMAETNRELLQLQFRVDTHSEQFRPLPVSEDRLDTSSDDSPGVLPPRAEPVLPSSTE